MMKLLISIMMLSCRCALSGAAMLAGVTLNPVASAAVTMKISPKLTMMTNSGSTMYGPFEVGCDARRSSRHPLRNC